MKKIFFERLDKNGELSLSNGVKATKVAPPTKGKKQRRGF